MRFMLLLKGDPQLDPDAEGAKATEDGMANPSTELIEAMIRYNTELAQAGVLEAAEGLQPSALGARVVYSKGSRSVVDGPFAEAKELVAGFFLIDVSSREEAIEWAKRCPVEYAVSGDMEAVVEVRQVGSSDELPQITAAQQAAETAFRDLLPDHPAQK